MPEFSVTEGELALALFMRLVPHRKPPWVLTAREAREAAKAWFEVGRSYYVEADPPIDEEQTQP